VEEGLIGAATTVHYTVMGKLVERMELKTTPRGKARYLAAAERRGLSLSDWARRGLDELADEELGADDEPRAPTAEDIAASLKARGALKGTGFGDRVRKARHSWTG
jgi:hypothetical protein